jgi:lycopene beta-cyclase
MKKYDYVIAGGGLSGLMLAFFLAHSSLKNKTILILEKNGLNPYKREWSFWINHQHPFENIVKHRWTALDAYFDASQFHLPLQKYEVQLIDSQELFKYILDSFSTLKNIDIHQEIVENIEENEDCGTVSTNLNTYSGGWVFNSLPLYSAKHSSEASMQGGSWLVRSWEPIFQSSVMTFCDYRHTVPGLPGFFYVLPMSRYQAVVYYASFSRPAQVSEAEITRHLKMYLSKNLGISNADISSNGTGMYPVPVLPNRRRKKSRVVPIGAAAGLIKPSTSYGFTNILHDSEALVASLEKNSHPYYDQKRSWLSTIGDYAMNRLVTTKPDKVKSLFEAVFASIATGDELLAFLDEKADKATNLKIIKGVNPQIFYS